MNELNPALMDILRLICSGLIGGIIGAFANDFFSRRRDRNTLKRNFIAKISYQKSAGDILEDFDGWFVRSKPVIEQECAMVETAIDLKWRERFDAARTKYANAQRKDIEDFSRDDFPQRIMTHQIGRITVAGLLQELILCASG